MYPGKYVSEDRLYGISLNSPLGEISLLSDGDALRFLYFEEEKLPSFTFDNQNRFLKEAKKQLLAFFASELKDFDLRLACKGSDFQKEVWGQLLKIPYGETRSYKDLAHALGRPRAARAVGNANGKNPIAIIIPCHRVIASSGALGGYSSGLDRKRFLLDLETLV